MKYRVTYGSRFTEVEADRFEIDPGGYLRFWNDIIPERKGDLIAAFAPPHWQSVSQIDAMTDRPQSLKPVA